MLVTVSNRCAWERGEGALSHEEKAAAERELEASFI